MTTSPLTYTKYDAYVGFWMRVGSDDSSNYILIVDFLQRLVVIFNAFQLCDPAE